MTLPRSQRHLLVRGGTVVTLDTERRVFEGDVLVTEGRIAAVGPRLAAPPATRLLPAEGLVVIPGLVQAHVHLGHRLFRGLFTPAEAHWRSPAVPALEAKLDPDDVYTSALLGAAECLLSGTTTVAEFGMAGHAESLRRAAEDSGIRARVGVLLRDRRPGESGVLRPADSRVLEHAAEFVRAAEGTARGRIRTALSPESMETASPELWSGVFRAARDLGVPVHTHLEGGSASPREIRAVAAAIPGIRLIAAHGVLLEEEDPGGLGASTPGFVLCPASQMHLGLGPVDLSRWRDVGVDGPALACDGIAGLTGFDAWEEMRLVSALDAAGGAGRLSARTVFESAVLGGARALGSEQESGSLEPGKFGDLVVLDLRGPRALAGPGGSVYERIVGGASPQAVRWTVVDGEVLVENGFLPHLGPEQLGSRAAETAARIGRAAETSKP